MRTRGVKVAGFQNDFDMHALRYESAYMTQVTIRQIEDEWVSAAKAKAAERGVSMNTVLKEAVKKGLGIVEKKKTNGLERFAGSCPDELSPAERNQDAYE